MVADPLHDPRWCRKVKSVEATGERHWLVIHKPVRLRPPTELALEQLDVQPPRRLTLREADEASIFQVEYRIEPIETGMRFTQVSEFEWKTCRECSRERLREPSAAAVSFGR